MLNTDHAVLHAMPDHLAVRARRAQALYHQAKRKVTRMAQDAQAARAAGVLDMAAWQAVYRSPAMVAACTVAASAWDRYTRLLEQAFNPPYLP